MITRVIGKVVDAGESWLEIRPHGLGIVLRTHVTEGTAASHPIDPGEVSLFTRIQVGDDGPSLFGFESRTEVNVYEALIGVSGVGPRLAMRILSALPADRLIHALNRGDDKALQSVSGVGARTAGRLVLELQGKLVADEVAGAVPDDSDEAIEALLALGYTRAEAMDGMSRGAEPGMSVEQQISAALKALAAR